MSVIERVRSRAGHKVIELIAGPDAAQRRQQIFDTPGPRWFAQDAPICRVHGDVAMYVGGIRALLLQSLHPVAMTAVAEHSSYRTALWGRVASTSRFISVTTFGTCDDAERAVARVCKVHSHIRGQMPDGTPYRADDPHLLQWVHAAEIDSFLTSYQRFGRGRLSRAEADEYVAQAGTVALRLGAERVPATVSELRETIARFRPELAGSPEAREAVRLLLTAPLSWTARVPYGTLCAVAIASLPLWARRMLGAPRLPVVDDIAIPLAGYGTGMAMVSALRWILTDPRD
ncbi:MAG: oxygenase MpaB family protein [Nakamurella sp.]